MGLRPKEGERLGQGHTIGHGRAGLITRLSFPIYVLGVRLVDWWLPGQLLSPTRLEWCLLQERRLSLLPPQMEWFLPGSGLAPFPSLSFAVICLPVSLLLALADRHLTQS